MRCKSMLWMLLLAALLPTVPASAAGKKTKKGKQAIAAPAPGTTSQKSDNGIKPYDKVITKMAETQRGVVSLHHEGRKLWMEIPDSMMGRPMLIAARVSEISNNQDIIAGRMPHNPLLVKWSRDERTVYLHQIADVQECDSTEAIYRGFLRNTIDPVLKSFPIAAFGLDSAAVFETSAFFCQDKAPFTPLLPDSGFASLLGMRRLKGKFQAEQSGVVGIKAFPENVNIKTRMVFDTKGMPFTALMTVSMLRLPDRPMRPRIANRAIGVFSARKVRFSEDKDYLKTYRIAERWNIAPRPEDLERYKRGETVEPAKPIVYYVDPAFPEKWRPWLKKGIEEWQAAFEKIGFRNAIVARDYPDDPDFDPEDIRHTCLIYSSSQTANAMGPSWTDPRSGEIIQASVYFYHNVLSVIHNWRFIQTATVDPKARAEVYDMDVMGPMLRYVVAHEVGHTLGLMHNMRGSFAYPVDSLRSPTFTRTFGTTASIMDYARFNYVAQPGDGVDYLLPPHLGKYDYYAIEWLYKPIFEAATPEDEEPVLQSWIDAKAGDPIYLYGEQGLFGAVDPASQSESLGDDAVKASRYGIRNLKIIADSLVAWTGYEGESFKYVSEMKTELFKQFKRYINHCQTYLGASYRYFSVVGSPQKAFEAVPKAKQQEALRFVFEQISELPEWYNDPATDRFLAPSNEVVTDYQITVVRNWIRPSTLMGMERCAKLSDDKYTASEFLDDVYRLVWNAPITGKRPSWGEQRMQYAFVQGLLGGLNKLDGQMLPKKSLADEYPMNFDPELLTVELYEYDYRPCAYDREMAPPEARGDSDLKMYVPTLYHAQLMKLKKLLESRIPSAKGAVADHYRYLLYEIDAAMR